MKIIDAPKPKRKGRGFSKKLNALAEEVKKLPQGKALSYPVPEGRTADNTRNSLSKALWRRAGCEKVHVTVINETELAIFISGKKSNEGSSKQS